MHRLIPRIVTVESAKSLVKVLTKTECYVFIYGKSTCPASGQNLAHGCRQRPQRHRTERKGIIDRTMPFHISNAGRSVVAFAFYRSGETLHSKYYDGGSPTPARAAWSALKFCFCLTPRRSTPAIKPMECRRKGRARKESPACISFRPCFRWRILCTVAWK